MKWVLVLPLFLSGVLTAPTLPSLPGLPGLREGATFQDVLGDVWKDTVKAGYSKAAVLQFLAGTGVNAAAEGYRAGSDYVQDTVKDIDLEAAVNATEDAVKAEKIAMIERIFNVKRQALRAIESLRSRYAATLNAFIQGSVTNVNAALATLGGGVVLSKEATFNLVNAMSMENLNDAINTAGNALANATDAIGVAIDDSAQAIQDQGNQFLENIVEIKQGLQEAAEDFNSQELLHSGAVNVGIVINTTVHGVQESVENMGVFEAIDDIVQTVVSGVPEKINSFLPEDAKKKLEDIKGNLNQNEVEIEIIETDNTKDEDHGEIETTEEEIKARTLIKDIHPDQVISVKNERGVYIGYYIVPLEAVPFIDENLSMEENRKRFEEHMKNKQTAEEVDGTYFALLLRSGTVPDIEDEAVVPRGFQ